MFDGLGVSVNLVHEEDVCVSYALSRVPLFANEPAYLKTSMISLALWIVQD